DVDFAGASDDASASCARARAAGARGASDAAVIATFSAAAGTAFTTGCGRFRIATRRTTSDCQSQTDRAEGNERKRAHAEHLRRSACASCVPAVFGVI